MLAKRSSFSNHWRLRLHRSLPRSLSTGSQSQCSSPRTRLLSPTCGTVEPLPDAVWRLSYRCLNSATGLSLDHSVPCCSFSLHRCEQLRVAESAHVGDSLCRSARPLFLDTLLVRCQHGSSRGLSHSLTSAPPHVLRLIMFFHQFVSSYHDQHCLIGRVSV